MNKKYWVVVLLTGILLFHFANNFVWLTVNNSTIEGCDGNEHMITALSFQLSLKAILDARLSFSGTISRACALFKEWPTSNWPPFIYLTAYWVNPDDFSFFRTRLYVNFIFFALLVLSVYFLGKKCFNRRVGLIAAFLVSFYPATYAFSRQFGLDFPLASLTAVCMCFWAYSENFSRRQYSLLFGLSLGIATLVKLQIMFFVCVPLTYSFFKIFGKENQGKLRSLCNLFFSLVVACFFFSLYWGAKLKDVLINFYQHAFSLYPFYKSEIVPTLGASMGLPTLMLSFKNVIFYPQWALLLLSFWLFGLFVVALLVFLIRKNKWRTFFLLNLLVPYLILTFISVKWPRYALPLLVPVSIISACFIDGLKPKYFKMLILGGVFFYCVGFNLSSSWHIYRDDYLPDYATPSSHPPDSEDLMEMMKKKGVISHIENRLRKQDRVKIRYLATHPLSKIMDLYLYFQNDILSNKIDIERISESDLNSLEDVDYVFAMLHWENPDLLSLDRGAFLPKEVLLKNYKVVSEVDDCHIFLERK